MSNRKYLRLADGYHDRSPYNPYQSSGKYSSKPPNSVQSDSSRSEARPSNVNGGTGSRNNSPRSRHGNLSPRSHRLKSSYSKTKELSKRGSSSSPVEAVAHNSSSSSDRMLKIDSTSTDDISPWSQHTSSSGKTYFYNCKTEKSQWEKPKEWVDRQKERERKKREGKEKIGNSREHLYANHGSTSKEKPRESSSKRDNQGNVDSSRISLEENRRYYQTNYQTSPQIIKTTSANTFAVSTTTHRPDLLSARPESTVSPSNSLQDISPPVTPSTVAVQIHSSPLISNSPIVTTHSPILLARQKSPILQQSPIHPRLPAVPHHGNSTTPPPPPPPLPTSSTIHSLHGVSSHNNDGHHYQSSSPQINVLTTTKLSDSSFNGIHVLSQSHLHPLQQATLLQAQFQSSSNVRPMTSGMMSGSPPHFQPIKQSNSTPGSPLSFNTRLYPTNSLGQTMASPKPPSVVYMPPRQSVNIQELALHFNRGLISHTLGWPSEPVERQSQKLSDDTFGLCSINNRLKADLIPLNFHHNLTAMRKGVGAKRIEFLREQRKKLEASDWIS